MKVTRGTGLLENFLAKKRAGMANKLISDDLRGGRILDIGCGSYPYFLNSIKFKEKYGLDKGRTGLPRPDVTSGLAMTLSAFDVEKEKRLPFGDEYFDVVTMLAVVEHLDPLILSNLFLEIRRVLKKNGEIIITTPAFWTGHILNLFSKLKLISEEEVGEHKKLYGKEEIVDILKKAGFNDVKAGYFEMGLNVWVKGKVGEIREIGEIRGIEI